MFSALTLIGFIGWKSTGNLTAGRSMAFFILALTQVIHSFNMRSNHSLFEIGAFTNKALNRAAIISTALIAVVTFVPPVTGFGLTQLSMGMYLGVFLAAVPVPAQSLLRVRSSTSMISFVVVTVTECRSDENK